MLSSSHLKETAQSPLLVEQMHPNSQSFFIAFSHLSDTSSLTELETKPRHLYSNLLKSCRVGDKILQFLDSKTLAHCAGGNSPSQVFGVYV